MKLLVIDNYDSFTYNLVHLLRTENVPHEVFRNDKITLEEASKYSHILFSPGPGVPSDAGMMPELIKKYAGQKPILGVCLGHQAIAEFLGGKIYNLKNVHHGVQSEIRQIKKNRIFENLPKNFQAGRYHSWAVQKKSLPASTSIDAIDGEGCIMAISEEEKKLYGVQFHPESILTPNGHCIISNFLKIHP